MPHSLSLLPPPFPMALPPPFLQSANLVKLSHPPSPLFLPSQTYPCPLLVIQQLPCLCLPLGGLKVQLKLKATVFFLCCMHVKVLCWSTVMHRCLLCFGLCCRGFYLLIFTKETVETSGMQMNLNDLIAFSGRTKLKPFCLPNVMEGLSSPHHASSVS